MVLLPLLTRASDREPGSSVTVLVDPAEDTKFELYTALKVDYHIVDERSN